jgi:hypothetical protein
VGLAAAVLAGMQVASGQQGTPPAIPPDAPKTQPATAGAQPGVQPNIQTGAGGTIHGTISSGTGKAAIPLPGVAVTATNTLTGKKYATSTDITGVFAMTIPRTGRYVVRAELAAFASLTKEVRITAEATDQVAEFSMELASRAAQEQAAEAGTATRRAVANALGGTQALTVTQGEAGQEAATIGGDNAGASLPSLGGLADAGGTTESVAVSGQQGTVNGLAGFNEDQVRQRIEDAIQQARQQGGATPDQISAVVGMLGGMMSGGPGGGFGGGPGGPGGPGGGGGGGRGGRGGGFGAFRNFNPAQPHGNIFYQGGNSALNSAPWSPTLEPETNPSAYQNRFGASIAGSPYIPGLTKPNTKQFVFINLTGQKNLNAFLPNPVRVPTALERAGDFSQSFQKVNNALVPVTLYDPATGQPVANNNLANATTPISPQALALLNYYPLCNINCGSTDPTVYNYQTISNAGSNNVAINTRYSRQLGQGAGTPFGGFGGGRGGGGGRNSNAPPVLRQNINASYNYSHSASDQRNIFLPLGGATSSDGNALTVGDTVSYGRLSNNASLTWNRSSSETRNYFTNTANDPTTAVGLSVPNQAGGFANPGFYNGLPSFAITNFASLTNTTPAQAINQTISFSDFVAWRHKKHNMRFGGDIRRVHADSIGGSDPLGQYTFTGYATSNHQDQSTATGGQTSGSGFADFLLGLPTSTKLQAGLHKVYLRENVYDWYATDDFRVKANLTLNYGLRYEYFAPYTEKNNRLVNLDHNADFTQVDPVQPGQRGIFQGTYPTSLVNPDRTLYAPRFGFAYRPKNKGITKDLVVRGGYGVNYNTGQFATFAKSLSFQPPFAATQTNTIPTPTSANPTPTATGCTTTTTTTTANLTLANGFSCATQTAIQNNYSVDKNYRLGMVQIYNFNLQKGLPSGIILNLGYNGSKGSNLDVLGSPNSTLSGSSIAGVSPFEYETSVAGSHSNQLIASIQRRQQKGIALGLTYVYAHAIDNASSIGGTSATTVQNFRRLDLEEANSSFDQRHNLSGNWLLELPFGPNRAFLNKGGAASRLLDGFSLSGTITATSGAYFTPQYSGNQAEASSGNDFTQRPDRVAGLPIRGAGTLREFFNTAAFAAPAATYGTASRNSIEGPGTLATTAALSRTVTLGETRSFEARLTASNVFNTVQYSGINTTVNSANYGQVTSAAAMRSLQFQARYRF